MMEVDEQHHKDDVATGAMEDHQSNRAAENEAAKNDYDKYHSLWTIQNILSNPISVSIDSFLNNFSYLILSTNTDLQAACQ